MTVMPAFNAREIADAVVASGLKGFPKTKRRVNALAKRESWQGRKRKGRKGGGGIEYPLSELPGVLRRILVDAHDVAPLLPPSSGQPDPVPGPRLPAAPLAPAAPILSCQADRVQARLYILNIFDIYRRARPNKGLWTCMNSFCKLYSARRLEIDAAVFADVAHVSTGSLHNWRKARISGAVNSMAGHYGNRAGSGVMDLVPGLKDLVIALICHNQHLNASHIQTQIKARFGDVLEGVDGETGEILEHPVPSVRSIQRWVSNWKASNQADYVSITDPDKFKSHYKVAFGSLYNWVTAVNQLWEIDASPADVLLRDGRYSIYVTVDVFTRRMMVKVSKTPKTAASLALFKRCVEEWGVPEILRTDNGSDFISFGFQSAVQALGVFQDICPPFKPEDKAIVERHIGTLQRDLMATLPGFIGHNVKDRSAIEARKTFARRLGESAEKAFAVDLTADELQAACNEWCAVKYMNRTHGGLNNKTPAEVLAGWTGSVRHIDNPDLLAFICAPVNENGRRKVTKNGIRIDNVPFAAPELGLHVGKWVYVRLDPEDMGVAYVFNEAGTSFVCKIFNLQSRGIDRAAITGHAQGLQNQQRKAARKQAQRIRIKPRDLLEGEQAVARGGSRVLPLPKPSTPHNTDIMAAMGQAVTGKRKKVTPPEMSEEAREHHAALVAEMEANNVTPLPESDRQRFRRALDVQAQIAAGEDVPTETTRWLGGYENTSEYRAQKQMCEEFGMAWLQA